MSNAFMARAASALRGLKVAQGRHTRLRARADIRLKAAQVRHESEIEAAANVEAVAWQLLLAVPGMTVTTAAALCETSDATVHRWAARGRGTKSRVRSGANGSRHEPGS